MLCVAACPQEAISSDSGYDHATLPRRESSAYLACARSGIDRKYRSIPCLHALSWRDVLRLYSSGVRTITVAETGCDDCQPRSASLEQTIARANEVLGSRGLTGLQLHYVPKDQWQREVGMVPLQENISAGRRAFFRRIVSPVDQKRSSEQVATVATLLGDNHPDGAIFPAVPVIDRDRCDGCDACVNVCPSGALAFNDDQSGPGYAIEASRCTGCKLRDDVCKPHAVAVRLWAQSEQRFVELRSQRCPACGVAYHAPKPRQDGLCSICSTRRYRHKLFQTDSV